MFSWASFTSFTIEANTSDVMGTPPTVCYNKQQTREIKSYYRLYNAGL